MLQLDDERWEKLFGGYKMLFDPRPFLMQLESGEDTTNAWRELWEGLHHQGDVGDASFAAVPHLVRIHRIRGVVDWNTYAMVAIIELARTNGIHPELPLWLNDAYFQAIQHLAEIGCTEVLRADGEDSVGAILSVIAVAKGLRIHGKFLVNYNENEMLDIESRL